MLTAWRVLSSMKSKSLSLDLLKVFSFGLLFGIFSEQQWKVFTGNEIGALLGWWSLQCLKSQQPDRDLKECYMLASTVSSKMLRGMAKAEGFNFIETLTGFKWMGNKSYELMNEGKTVLFAFEEAIGFMFAPTVLDKDGVSAACHLATMAAYLKAKNQTLSGQLNELYERYGYHYTNNSYYLCYEPETIDKIFERIRNFKSEPNTVIKTINLLPVIVIKCYFHDC